jgi:hypothetical protein
MVALLINIVVCVVLGLWLMQLQFDARTSHYDGTLPKACAYQAHMLCGSNTPFNPTSCYIVHLKAWELSGFIKSALQRLQSCKDAGGCLFETSQTRSIKWLLLALTVLAELQLGELMLRRVQNKQVNVYNARPKIQF